MEVKKVKKLQLKLVALGKAPIYKELNKAPVYKE
jgi:hypothetical protein